MFSIKRLAVILGMISAACMVAFAQQPAQTPGQEGHSPRANGAARKTSGGQGRTHENARAS